MPSKVGGTFELDKIDNFHSDSSSTFILAVTTAQKMSLYTPIPRWPRLVSITCQAGPSRIRIHARYNSSASQNPPPSAAAPEDFAGWDAELRRRMRKVNAKRRQSGADFVDHLLVTVRGGTSFISNERHCRRCSGKEREAQDGQIILLDHQQLLDTTSGICRQGKSFMGAYAVDTGGRRHTKGLAPCRKALAPDQH